MARKISPEEGKKRMRQKAELLCRRLRGRLLLGRYCVIHRDRLVENLRMFEIETRRIKEGKGPLLKPSGKVKTAAALPKF